MRSLIVLSTLAATLSTVAFAQDPADGWLSYATASCPNGQRLTHFSGNWKIPSNPQPSDAFFSPWIGMDPADNLNLLQPVNPWLGDGWAIYSEYYQWVPENNINSNQLNANAGDFLHGTIDYNGDSQSSYNVMQNDLTQGIQSGMTIPVQTGNNGLPKNYSIAYVVFEKTAYCGDYPPDEQILFTNLTMYCDNKPYVPTWTTSFVDDCCQFRAHVVDPYTIKMTWTTDASKSLPKEKIETQYAKNRQLKAALKARKTAAAAGGIKAEKPPQKKNE